MFGIKGKPNLQDLEKEFSVYQFELGSVEFQIDRLQKRRAQVLQKMDALSKKGQTTRQKIQTELKNKIEEGHTALKETEEEEVKENEIN